MGQTDEETIAENFKTTSIAAYGRKDFIMKKRLGIFALVFVLITVLCTQVWASEEVIGDMGTRIISDANDVYLGEGGLWNDSQYEFTLGGYISAIAPSGLELTLDMDYTHYDTGADLYREDSWEACGAESLNGTLYLSPNEGTPYYGFGNFEINGFFNAVGDDWYYP